MRSSPRGSTSTMRAPRATSDTPPICSDPMRTRALLTATRSATGKETRSWSTRLAFARGLVDGDEGLRANANRVDHERVSFPVADRVAVRSARVRIGSLQMGGVSLVARGARIVDVLPRGEERIDVPHLRGLECPVGGIGQSTRCSHPLVGIAGAAFDHEQVSGFREHRRAVAYRVPLLIGVRRDFLSAGFCHYGSDRIPYHVRGRIDNP